MYTILSLLPRACGQVTMKVFESCLAGLQETHLNWVLSQTSSCMLGCPSVETSVGCNLMKQQICPIHFHSIYFKVTIGDHNCVVGRLVGRLVGCLLVTSFRVQSSSHGPCGHCRNGLTSGEWQQRSKLSQHQWNSSYIINIS